MSCTVDPLLFSSFTQSSLEYIQLIARGSGYDFDIYLHGEAVARVGCEIDHKQSRVEQGRERRGSECRE